MSSQTTRAFGLDLRKFSAERGIGRRGAHLRTSCRTGRGLNALFQSGRAIGIAAAGSVLLACAPRVEAQAPSPAGSRPASREAGALPQIDISAHRRSLEKRLRAFVAAATPRDYVDSLTRWNEPVCPVVVGPPPRQIARIRARLLRIAAAAGVPIKPEPCQANLYVIATPYPKRLLTAWGKRDHLLFSRASRKSIEEFIDTPRPVRVWYNTMTVAPEPDTVSPEQYGENPTQTEAPGGAAGATAAETAAAAVTAAVDAAQDYSLLHFEDIQSFASVIAVIDTKRAAGFSLDQLSDYIAMVGLAKIDMNADFHGAPTILSLFAHSADGAGKPTPTSMTGWDRDYLKALYATRQVSREQRMEIADMMVREMMPRVADH